MKFYAPWLSEPHAVFDYSGRSYSAHDCPELEQLAGKVIVSCSFLSTADDANAQLNVQLC